MNRTYVSVNYETALDLYGKLLTKVYAQLHSYLLKTSTLDIPRFGYLLDILIKLTVVPYRVQITRFLELPSARPHPARVATLVYDGSTQAIKPQCCFSLVHYRDKTGKTFTTATKIALPREVNLLMGHYLQAKLKVVKGVRFVFGPVGTLGPLPTTASSDLQDLIFEISGIRLKQHDLRRLFFYWNSAHNGFASDNLHQIAILARNTENTILNDYMIDVATKVRLQLDSPTDINLNFKPEGWEDSLIKLEAGVPSLHQLLQNRLWNLKPEAPTLPQPLVHKIAKALLQNPKVFTRANSEEQFVMTTPDVEYKLGGTKVKPSAYVPASILQYLAAHQLPVKRQESDKWEVSLKKRISRQYRRIKEHIENKKYVTRLTKSIQFLEVLLLYRQYGPNVNVLSLSENHRLNKRVDGILNSGESWESFWKALRQEAELPAEDRSAKEVTSDNQPAVSTSTTQHVSTSAKYVGKPWYSSAPYAPMLLRLKAIVNTLTDTWFGGLDSSPRCTAAVLVRFKLGHIFEGPDGWTVLPEVSDLQVIFTQPSKSHSQTKSNQWKFVYNLDELLQKITTHVARAPARFALKAPVADADENITAAQNLFTRTTGERLASVIYTPLHFIHPQSFKNAFKIHNHSQKASVCIIAHNQRVYVADGRWNFFRAHQLLLPLLSDATTTTLPPKIYFETAPAGHRSWRTIELSANSQVTTPIPEWSTSTKDKLTVNYAQVDFTGQLSLTFEYEGEPTPVVTNNCDAWTMYRIPEQPQQAYKQVQKKTSQKKPPTSRSSQDLDWFGFLKKYHWAEKVHSKLNNPPMSNNRSNPPQNERENKPHPESDVIDAFSIAFTLYLQTVFQNVNSSA